jgi:Protein of unknown function (DUF3662)/FHA domain
MAILRGIEQRLESLFEGIFGRAFRANVQPIELARKLRKEMDDHRSVSVSRVYVPNEYTVYLSPGDREQFAGYEPSLIDELQNHLADHAKREGYALMSPPIVLMETDEDLAVGEFGIAVRMVQPGRGRGVAVDAAPPDADVEPGHTMIYRPRAQPTQAVSATELGVEREVVSLTWDGERREIRKRRTVIGRSKDCDVQLADPNVSRRHAELRQEGTAYWVVDLDSTNGLEVNGKRLKRAKLDDGDSVTVGSTEITFRRETA